MMKHTGFLAVLVLLSVSVPARGVDAPSEWKQMQEVVAPAPGLMRLNIPIETLGASRPELEDLRLYDPDGREVPFVVEQTMPTGRILRGPRSSDVSLVANSTVITMETGLADPIDEVTLTTPAASFIKAVSLDGSNDRAAWSPIVAGIPVFRQPGGMSHLRIPFPPSKWAYLRLKVDDRRSPPIPLTAVTLRAGMPEPLTESVPLSILERVENLRETRLVLALPAANLRVASLSLDTVDPLFSRDVTVASRQVGEGGVRELEVARATICRLSLEGQASFTNLEIKVEATVPTREIVLLVHNQDSPPLTITGAMALRRPANMVFHAARAGTYHLATGNGQCARPRYDLASLGTDLKGATALPVVPGPLLLNPSYRVPTALPSLSELGAVLDVASWKYRKAVQLSRSGAQDLDLDLEVLAHAQRGLQDLRLMRGDHQVPFIREETSITRTLIPQVSPANDPKQPKLSRWALKLPMARVPVTRLVCTSPTPVFQRDVALSEEIPGDRGETYRRALGQGVWLRTLEQPARQLVLELAGLPESDVLFLETQNGDNPPILLEDFQCSYRVSRLVFKAESVGELELYYGNPEAGAPDYDLTLVARQLQMAEKSSASLGSQEQLNKGSWREQWVGGKSAGLLFWSVLAAVVVGLLFVISRLLPKA